MRLSRHAHLLLATFLLAGSGWSQAPAGVDAIAKAVDKRYNGLKTLSAEFDERYSGAAAARTESGMLWLKKPGKMRWEFRSPKEKLFLTDGRTAWFYVPGERQARRAPVKKLDDLRWPLRYLLGRTKLQKEFEGLSLAPDLAPAEPGNVVLRGIPRGMEERVSHVLLEITPERRIARILVEELDGSQTEFRFRQQRENVAVADAQFKFQPPPGVELIETDDLGE